jgi:adenylosuccinate synthase
MLKAQVVIGANYGDEGKGLVTDYLCSQEPENTIVVRYNGGAQAGHTVISPIGKRHIFHSIGSGGLLSGASTHLASKFILNPDMFNNEAQHFHGHNVTVSPEVRVSTIYDIILNQQLEKSRGTRKHGSCGVGIYETIRRNQKHGLKATLEDIIGMTFSERQAWLHRIRLNTIAELVEHSLPGWLTDFLRIDTIKTFDGNFREMLSNVRLLRDGDLQHEAKNLIFEGAQGLGLDDAYGTVPFLTPSRVGLSVPRVICDANFIRDVTVVYVTRTYLTRHGEGPLPRESSREALGIKEYDFTNEKNEWQGDLRYAPLTVDDAYRSNNDFRINAGPDYKKKVAFTCMDQHTIDITRTISTYNCKEGYVSMGPTRDTISPFRVVEKLEWL